MNRLPYEGLRVVEVGNVIAGPLCGSLLADFGADVIKVERPDGGDAARQLGLEVDGIPVWWGIGVRDKQCVTLDLKDAQDRQILLDLLAGADVMIENNRPGALDRMGLGHADLRRLNPGLVMVSISGFGQTGPMAPVPGFGKIAEAFSGIVPLTGAPGAPPVHVGFSLADATSSLFGLLGAATALWARDCNGQTGAHVDLALYEPLLRMLELQAALLQQDDRPPTRQGSNNPWGWGAGDDGARMLGLRCGDGAELLVLLCSGDAARLAALCGDDPVAWAGGLPLDHVAAALKAAGLEAAPVQDGQTLAQGAYFQARGDVVPAILPSGRQISVPGHALRQLQATTPRRAFRAAALGADQDRLTHSKQEDSDG